MRLNQSGLGPCAASASRHWRPVRRARRRLRWRVHPARGKQAPPSAPSSHRRLDQEAAPVPSSGGLWGSRGAVDQGGKVLRTRHRWAGQEDGTGPCPFDPPSPAELWDGLELAWRSQRPPPAISGRGRSTPIGSFTAAAEFQSKALKAPQMHGRGANMYRNKKEKKKNGPEQTNKERSRRRNRRRPTEKQKESKTLFLFLFFFFFWVLGVGVTPGVPTSPGAGRVPRTKPCALAKAPAPPSGPCTRSA